MDSVNGRTLGASCVLGGPEAVTCMAGWGGQVSRPRAVQLGFGQCAPVCLQWREGTGGTGKGTSLGGGVWVTQDSRDSTRSLLSGACNLENRTRASAAGSLGVLSSYPSTLSHVVIAEKEGSRAQLRSTPKGPRAQHSTRPRLHRVSQGWIISQDPGKPSQENHPKGTGLSISSLSSWRSH